MIMNGSNQIAFKSINIFGDLPIYIDVGDLTKHFVNPVSRPWKRYIDIPRNRSQQTAGYWTRVLTFTRF